MRNALGVSDWESLEVRVYNPSMGRLRQTG